MEDMKIVNEIYYNISKIGISICSFEEVEIIGERDCLIEGLLYSQYMYNIINYKPKNGQPFIALKDNIQLRNEVAA